MRKLETIDEAKLTKNPFAELLTISAASRTSISEFVVSEEVEELLVGKKFPIDRVQKVSIYYTVGIRDKIYKLSLQAKSLLFYILYNLDPNRDYVQINRQYYMSQNKVKSHNTFRAALVELCENQIILPTGIYNTVYWINPKYIFPGNRLDKYKNKIEITHEI